MLELFTEQPTIAQVELTDPRENEESTYIIWSDLTLKAWWNKTSEPFDPMLRSDYFFPSTLPQIAALLFGEESFKLPVFMLGGAA